MVVGVVIGEFAPGVQHALDASKLHGVSLRKLTISLISKFFHSNNLCSDCARSHHNDVACPDKNSI